MISTIMSFIILAIMFLFVCIENKYINDIYKEKKSVSYHYVYFKDGEKGIRFFPTNIVIMKNDVTETEWKELLKLANRQ